MELSHSLLYIVLIVLFISERLNELRSANRNSDKLLERGGREFGAAHYPVIVAMHSAFFASLVTEFIMRNEPLASYFVLPLFLLLGAQVLRLWVRRAMKDRWTTRIIVVPGENLITSGPFRYVAHPIYIAVAIELFTLPLIFGLYVTCFVFTMLNATLLLFIRIPTERRALRWSQQTSAAAPSPET
jgi:methyltransferase